MSYLKKCLGLLCVFVSFLISCDNNLLNKQIKDFASTPIIIPIDKMEYKICSLFHDTIQIGKNYRVVNYIDKHQCVDCVLSYYSAIEGDKQYEDIMKRVSMVYIIDVDSLTKDDVCSYLYNERIKGKVYLDSQGSFIKSNPMVAESQLFQTFVLDDSNKIVLLGDPFKNEQMVELLRTRISNAH